MRIATSPSFYRSVMPWREIYSVEETQAIIWAAPDCMPNPLVQQRLEMAVMFQFSADLTITPLADRS